MVAEETESLLMRWTLFVKLERIKKKEITDTRLLHIGEFLLNWPKTHSSFFLQMDIWTNYSSDVCSFRYTKQFSIRYIYIYIHTHTYKYIYIYTQSISQVIRRLIFCLAAATERTFQFPFLVVCNRSIDSVDQFITYVRK